MSCMILACVTVALIFGGSSLAGLACGLTGIVLMIGAFIDDVSPKPVRAVMAAAGLALTLFGLVPWWELTVGHAS